MENKQMIINGVFAIWLVLLTYTVFSANGDNDRLARAQAVANAPISTQTAIKPTNTSTEPIKPEVALDPSKAAKIEFNETVFDFGTLEEGDQVTHLFKFKNTSENPLTITNARGSCGCTVPEWPKAPIAPGESGEIKVKFDSKGKKGNQSKTVTLQANTIPGNTVLTIKSNVIGKDIK